MKTFEINAYVYETILQNQCLDCKKDRFRHIHIAYCIKNEQPINHVDLLHTLSFKTL